MSEPFDADGTLATPEQGADMRRQLQSALAVLTHVGDDGARFAYDESKATYELSRDRFKGLDNKAVTLAGLVTTILGAIAVLGNPVKAAAGGALLAFAVSAICASLVAALLSLAPRGVASPDLSPYVWPATLANRDNLARVRVHVARAWLRDAATLEHANRAKGRRLVVATLSLVVGLVALVIGDLRAPATTQAVPLRVIITTPAPTSTTHERIPHARR